MLWLCAKLETLVSFPSFWGKQTGEISWSKHKNKPLCFVFGDRIYGVQTGPELAAIILPPSCLSLLSVPHIYTLVTATALSRSNLTNQVGVGHKTLGFSGLTGEKGGLFSFHTRLLIGTDLGISKPVGQSFWLSTVTRVMGVTYTAAGTGKLRVAGKEAAAGSLRHSPVLGTLREEPIGLPVWPEVRACSQLPKVMHPRILISGPGYQ